MSLSWKNIRALTEAPFTRRLGLSRENPNPVTGKHAMSNGFAEVWRNAADTRNIEGVRVGLDDSLMMGGAPVAPMAWPLVCRVGANAEAIDFCFHVFNQPSSITSGQPIGRVLAVEGIFGTQASTGTVTAQITKDRSGQAPGAGVALTSNSFNLRGTNNVVQALTLVTSNQEYLEFTGGDRLSLNITGTPTSFAGGLFVVWVQYYVRMAEISFYRPAVDGNDQAFFVANRPYTFWGASYSHAVAEATAETMYAQLTLDTSTNAPGAGTDELTNNTNSGFDCKATANIPQVGTIAAAFALATGDRLSVDYAGSPTEHLGAVLTVAFTPQIGRVEAPYFRRDTNALDECYFLAPAFQNRDWEVWDARQVHAVAAGGTSTAQVTKDVSTNAPGAGTDLLATAWDLNGTANTVQILDPITSLVKQHMWLQSGGRLAIDYGHAEQSLIGNAMTVSLFAR